jgi:hypothetical protein
MHHAMALLVADQPAAALNVAKEAMDRALDPKDVLKANEIYACCLKAQDGTVGRANAWLAARPAPAPVGKPDANIP